MEMTFCSNCGCNLTEDGDSNSPYMLTIEVPSPEAHDLEPFGSARAYQYSYQLCACCAKGISDILENNEASLLKMHGETCNDILPVQYRCVHS